jgi:hypothetical protein
VFNGLIATATIVFVPQARTSRWVAPGTATALKQGGCVMGVQDPLAGKQLLNNANISYRSFCCFQHDLICSSMQAQHCWRDFTQRSSNCLVNFINLRAIHWDAETDPFRHMWWAGSGMDD